MAISFTLAWPKTNQDSIIFEKLRALAKQCGVTPEGWWQDYRSGNTSYTVGISGLKYFFIGEKRAKLRMEKFKTESQKILEDFE